MADFKLLLIVGRSRTGKSTLANAIVGAALSNRKPMIFFADSFSRRNIYENVSYGWDSTLEKDLKALERWSAQNEGRWVVIDDITLKLTEKLKNTLTCFLTRRRLNLILVTQNMRDMKSFVQEPRFCIFFDTGNLVNLRTITQSNEKKVARRIRSLKEHEFFMLDTKAALMSDVRTCFTPDLMSILEDGLNEGESYLSKELRSVKMDAVGRPVELDSVRHQCFKMFGEGKTLREAVEKFESKAASKTYHQIHVYYSQWKQSKGDVN